MTRDEPPALASGRKAYSIYDLPDDVAAELLAALGETITGIEEPVMQSLEKEALERLIAIAQRNTGQSRRVADFLLAWWNPAECGGFDITTLWGLDTPIVEDATTVFGMIARVGVYPGALGYEADFRLIVEQWRPELVTPR